MRCDTFEIMILFESFKKYLKYNKCCYKSHYSYLICPSFKYRRLKNSGGPNYFFNFGSVARVLSMYKKIYFKETIK